MTNLKKEFEKKFVGPVFAFQIPDGKLSNEILAFLESKIAQEREAFLEIVNSVQTNDGPTKEVVEGVKNLMRNALSKLQGEIN